MENEKQQHKETAKKNGVLHALVAYFMKTIKCGMRRADECFCVCMYV